MKGVLIAFALLLSGAAAQGIDAEFEAYKTPEGLEKHFYQGRVDSTFFKDRRKFDRQCAVKDITSLGAFIYYIFPMESLILGSLVSSGGGESAAFAGMILLPFYVLPTAGHLYFIKGTDGLSGLHRKYVGEPQFRNNGRTLYYSGLALRLVAPFIGIWILDRIEQKDGLNNSIPLLPFLLVAPALQWHGLQKIDDERMFLSGGLDDVKLSPSVGLRVDPRDGRPGLQCGLRLSMPLPF